MDIEVLYIFIALVLSIVVHETVHSIVAYWLGDDTSKNLDRFTLNPLKHIDPVTTIGLPMIMVIAGLPPLIAAKPVPVDKYRLKWGEYGMAIVAIAGPLSNLLLAILFGIILANFNFNSNELVLLVKSIVSINISLFVFNMLPIPPLDGSRLLRAFAPDPVVEILDFIEAQGFMAIIAIFILLQFSFFSDFLTWMNVQVWTTIFSYLT